MSENNVSEENQWYYYKDGQQLGPTEFNVLKSMAASGELPPNTYISQPGMTEWVELQTREGVTFPAGTALPPPPPTPQSTSAGASAVQTASRVGPSPWERARSLASSEDGSALTPHLRWLESLLQWLRRRLTVDRLQSLNRVSSNLGHVAFALTILVLVLAQIVFAIKTETFMAAVMALLLTLPLGLVLHFAAARFLHSGVDLVQDSPSRMGSKSFLDVFALLALSLGLTSLVVLSYAGFESQQLDDKIDVSLIAAAIGLFFLFLIVCGYALQPQILNIEIDDSEKQGSRTGEEALGIVAFLTKLALRLVPVAFGVGAAVGAFTALKLLVQVFDGRYFNFMTNALGWIPLPGGNLLTLGLLPLFAYLTALGVYLIIDLYRAILATPRRIERLSSYQPPSPRDSNPSDHPS